MTLSEILNLKLSDIVAMFKKKPDVWYEFTLQSDYDLTKHPEISTWSPIKNFSLTKRYRYYPDKKVLQRRSFTKDEWYSCKDESKKLDVHLEIRKIEHQHNRDTKINKILK